MLQLMLSDGTTALIHSATSASLAGDCLRLDGAQPGDGPEFYRFLVEHRPRLALIRSDPGLLSANGGTDFAVLLAGLSGVLPGVPAGGWRTAGFGRGLFYNVAWRVLDDGSARPLYIAASLGSGVAADLLLSPGDTPLLRY